MSLSFSVLADSRGPRWGRHPTWFIVHFLKRRLYPQLPRTLRGPEFPVSAFGFSSVLGLEMISSLNLGCVLVLFLHVSYDRCVCEADGGRGSLWRELGTVL